ncbi:hypothetical protein [Streptomyces sp. NRRL B-24572]|uniref:hypothetical protein n=1 Tax=Streptomyces sp. NRRL B-24572 TaxID=1962156 RepID=UPI000A3B5234|nr:hypothetical protein [Streptomyces sp. NRRL B-24572]
MGAPAVSPECRLAQVAGYEDMHRECRQTKDVPLPHGAGILVVRRCTCSHHSYNRRPGPRVPAQEATNEPEPRPTVERRVVLGLPNGK